MYFIALTFRMQMVEGVMPAELQSGVYAHAAVMRAITNCNEEFGRHFHGLGSQRLFTAAIVERNQKDALFRLTFMSEHGLEAANAAVTGFSNCPIVRLGTSSHHITDVCLAGSSWSGVSTWADLMSVRPGLRFHFTFQTPTAFTKDNGNGRRFCTLYPEPNDLFRGLARRWRELGGPHLPESLGDYLHRGGCVVASHQLRTETAKLKERVQVGFRGTATYECLDRDPVHVAALSQLTRFAFFSGVGYQTARGMGAVKTRTLL